MAENNRSKAGAKKFDVVIVGSGIAGCVLAKTLTQAGKKVLLLEAGLKAGVTLDRNGAFYNYMDYLNRFYLAPAKVPNSPYPNSKDAPSIDVLDIQAISGCNNPSTKGYLVQAGPLPFGSDCFRGPGGTTLHWLGSTPRMLPNDFKMKTLYNRGVDWPFEYKDLMPYYEMAEFEIGVSGDVSALNIPDSSRANYGKNYEFPMQMIPQSYMDSKFMGHFKDKKSTTIKLNGRTYQVMFTSMPQGRNSIPNHQYPNLDLWWNKNTQSLEFKTAKSKNEAGYQPVGATWDPNNGLRCEGNASCVPICPVQAKYNALKTLRKADQSKLHIKTQSVASRVLLDKSGKKVKGIEYKQYEDPNTNISAYETYVAEGEIYVLAASAIENAKILLASEVGNRSGQVGRNLMDHMVMLTWGLMPEKAYPFRGPGSTTNISTFRDGDFRKEHAAWISPLDNWGWGWPVFSPGSDVDNALAKGVFGKKLRAHLNDVLTRQILLHFECEQIPEGDINYVTIDPKYRDALGNYRPVVHYNASEYMLKSFEAAREVSKQIFEAAGIEDHTTYSPSNPDYVEYKGKGYNFWGAGHIVGTHRMGTNGDESVTNENGRCWDHENLFLAGCGNMPTLGTSNPTLTMTALTFKSAEAILRQLEK